MVASVLTPVVASSARQVVGDDAERLDAEPALAPSGGSPHEQLEGSVGDLEVVALVLEALELVDDVVDLRAVEGPGRAPWP